MKEPVHIHGGGSCGCWGTWVQCWPPAWWRGCAPDWVVQRVGAFVLGHTRQAKGYQEYWEELWDKMASMVKQHEVTFIGGDFNLALFVAKGHLELRGVRSTFLGSYAWRQISETTHLPEPGFAGVRFDSIGLFAVGAVTSVARWITPEITPPPGPVGYRQGYVASSYGGENAVKTAFASPVVVCAAGEEETCVVIKQKPPSFNICYPSPKSLLGKGAHMPLLFFWGGESRRSAGKIKECHEGGCEPRPGARLQRQQAAAEQRQQAAAGIHGARAKGGGKAAGGGKARGQPLQTDWQSPGGRWSRGAAWPGRRPPGL